MLELNKIHNMDVLDKEVWKDIEGYNGKYQVSNFGRVKSMQRFVKRKSESKTLLSEKLMKIKKDKDGYLLVDLYKDNIIKRMRVHRLVAEAFIDNPENKPHVDHINTIRDDNRVENLRWVTRKENMNNPATYDKLGKHSRKKILQFSTDGTFIREWESAREIERELLIDNSWVAKCCKGKCKSAKGFIFKYDKEVA